VGGTAVGGTAVGGTRVAGTLVGGALVGGTLVAGTLVGGAGVRVGGLVAVGGGDVLVALGGLVAAGAWVGTPAGGEVGFLVGGRLGTAVRAGSLVVMNPIGVTVGTEVCRSETTVASRAGALGAAGWSFSAEAISPTPTPETGTLFAETL
jgi:hypothetical protein